MCSSWVPARGAKHRHSGCVAWRSCWSSLVSILHKNRPKPSWGGLSVGLPCGVGLGCEVLSLEGQLGGAQPPGLWILVPAGDAPQVPGLVQPLPLTQSLAGGRGGPCPAQMDPGLHPSSPHPVASSLGRASEPHYVEASCPRPQVGVSPLPLRVTEEALCVTQPCPRDQKETGRVIVVAPWPQGLCTYSATSAPLQGPGGTVAP